MYLINKIIINVYYINVLHIIHEVNHEPSDDRASNRCAFADLNRATIELNTSGINDW